MVVGALVGKLKVVILDLLEVNDFPSIVHHDLVRDCQTPSSGPAPETNTAA